MQYALQRSDVEAAVANINEKLGSQIAAVEYGSVAEQAAALHSGEVQAIIYNDAYSQMLEEGLGEEQENFKVIYTYEVKSKVENKAAQVEVKDETFTVYISGIDVYGAIETNSRSDVNILAVVNPNTHQVLLVTTPRDYYVQIPGISGDMRDTFASKIKEALTESADSALISAKALLDLTFSLMKKGHLIMD